MIRLQHVSKTYVMGEAEIHALRDVSLEVGQGEFVAVVGRSGSGKSTLMNLLGCLDTPTGGRYELDGRAITSMPFDALPEVRSRQIGFVFQSFHLLSRLSALENVEMPLIYQGIARKKRRELAVRALEKVGLGDRMGHRPYQMSGGQQQRVAIARAIVTEPPLILADEPTGNLDEATGRDILELLAGFHRMGHTLLLITHDMAVAGRADRIIHLEEGSVSRTGTDIA